MSAPPPGTGPPPASPGAAVVRPMAGRERITALRVTLEDGRTFDWTGHGSVAVEHTQTVRRTPMVNDTHYVEAILRFEPGPFPETKVDPYAVPVERGPQ